MRYRDINFKKPSKNDNYFPTQEIRAKGFSRVLKSLVLNKDITECLEKPEHEAVLTALNNAINNSPLITDEFKKKTENKDFVSTSRLSDWWNGKGFPTTKNKEMINLVFNGLSDHWFSRGNFNHRIPMYLASIDLPYSYSKNTKISEAEEGTEILKIISKNWAPFMPENDTSDLCIYGSIQRAGYNKRVGDTREDETYDLSMTQSSYVGIEIPSYIAKIYQENYLFSIVPYMFCLLCLNTNDNKSGYKLDLVFDLLTALNCVTLQIERLEASYDSNDLVQKQIFSIYRAVKDLFHNKSYLPSKLKTEIEEYNELKDINDLPCLALINHPLYRLPSLFISILKDYLSESELSELYQKTKVEGGNNSLNEVTEELTAHHNIFGFNTAQEVKKNAICLNGLKNENGLECWEISQHALNIFSEAINFYFLYFKMTSGLEPIKLLESFDPNVTTNEDISNLKRVTTRYTTERHPLKP